MSNIYSLISFLAFFVLCILLLDFFLPTNKSFVTVIKNSEKGNIEVNRQEDLKKHKGSPKQLIVLEEKTPLLQQQIATTYIENGIAKKRSNPSVLFLPGFVFILFLVIGSIYGMFFKKPAYQERRAAYYNIIVCFLLFILFVFSI